MSNRRVSFLKRHKHAHDSRIFTAGIAGMAIPEGVPSAGMTAQREAIGQDRPDHTGATLPTR